MKKWRLTEWNDAQSAVRAEYSMELGRLAREIAVRYRSGLLADETAVRNQLGAMAAKHPWVLDPFYARFVVACSDHPHAASRAGEPVVDDLADVRWSALARYAFEADLKDVLVEYRGPDLRETVGESRVGRETLVGGR